MRPDSLMNPESVDVGGAQDAPPEVHVGKRSFAVGLAAQAGARWSAQIISWVSTIVVARRLSPVDYGVIGMALAYLGVAGIVAEFGLSATVVARRDLSEEQSGQLASVALMAGALVCATSWLIAPLIADFYDEPRVFWAVGIMSTSFVFSGVSSVPMAELRKSLNYRSVATAELIGAATTTICVLLLAVSNLGFWALAFGNLAGAIAISARVGAQGMVQLRVPKWHSIRGPLSTARHLTIGQTAYYAYVSSDSFAVGKLLGTTAMGVYRFAWFIASLPGEKLVNIVGSMSLAYFSERSSNKPELRRFFLMLTELMSVVVFPALFGLLLVADSIIPLVFGDKWSGSIAPFRFMTAGAVFQVLAVLYSQVLTATHQARTASRFTIVSLFVAAPAFFLAAKSGAGITAVAAVWALAQPIVSIPPFLKVRATLGFTIYDYIRTLAPAFIGCLFMGSCVLLVRLATPTDWSTWLRVVLQILTGAISYIGMMGLAFRPRLLSLFAAVRST